MSKKRKNGNRKVRGGSNSVAPEKTSTPPAATSSSAVVVSSDRLELAAKPDVHVKHEIPNFEAGEMREPEDSMAGIVTEAQEQVFFDSLTPPPVEEVIDEEEVRRSIIIQTQARARRAHFSRYVGIAVAVSLAVCTAAGVRRVIFPKAETSIALAAEETAPAQAAGGQVVVTSAEQAPAPKVEAPVVATEPVAPIVEQAKVEAKIDAAVPTPHPGVAEAEATKTPVQESASDKPSAPTKTAVQEKADAQRALDRGNLAEAIAAGERSIALDETNGDAWLVLGAAYQMKGKAADARRCFQSCTKLGKRGSISECRAMLQ